jgi:hypothetical protein
VSLHRQQLRHAVPFPAFFRRPDHLPIISANSVYAEMPQTPETWRKVAETMYPDAMWHGRRSAFSPDWLRGLLARHPPAAGPFQIRQHHAVQDKGDSPVRDAARVKDYFDSLERAIGRYGIKRGEQVSAANRRSFFPVFVFFFLFVSAFLTTHRTRSLGFPRPS